MKILRNSSCISKRASNYETGGKIRLRTLLLLERARAFTGWLPTPPPAEFTSHAHTRQRGERGKMWSAGRTSPCQLLDKPRWLSFFKRPSRNRKKKLRFNQLKKKNKHHVSTPDDLAVIEILTSDKYFKRYVLLYLYLMELELRLLTSFQCSVPAPFILSQSLKETDRLTTVVSKQGPLHLLKLRT